MKLQRAAVLLPTVLALAWLGVSYHDARVTQHARDVSGDQKATPAEIDAALRAVRDDLVLDPSRTESLSYQASLEIRAGRSDEARKLFEQIVRREPDYREAWLVLYQLTEKSDPARSAQALAQVRRLDPLGAPRP
jgi:cytochrome c-type biogenesis protein CcmH/NrfG